MGEKLYITNLRFRFENVIRSLLQEIRKESLTTEAVFENLGFLRGLVVAGVWHGNLEVKESQRFFSTLNQIQAECEDIIEEQERMIIYGNDKEMVGL